MINNQWHIFYEDLIFYEDFLRFNSNGTKIRLDNNLEANGFLYKLIALLVCLIYLIAKAYDILVKEIA